MATIQPTDRATVTPPPNAGKGGDSPKKARGKSGQNAPTTNPTANKVAIIVLALYVVVGGILMLSLDLPEVTWSRIIFVYGGLEAIAFGAAGYFFGKEVHRDRAEAAEKTAADAEDTARTEAEAKTVAETNFNALEKYIDIHKPSGSSHVASLAELINDAEREPEMLNRFPELVSTIRAKHDAALSTPDPHWNALQKYAKSLREPRAS